MAVVLKRGILKRRIFQWIIECTADFRRNPYVRLFETTGERLPVALKLGRVKRWIFESIIEKFTGAVPNNSDDSKSRMLRWNPSVRLFETTGAAAQKYGNSECQKVLDMIPVPPQQAFREHSQNDGNHGGSVVNNITISQNTFYATNSKGVGISLTNSREVEDIRNMVLVNTVFTGLGFAWKPFFESSLTDPIENIDTKTIEDLLEQGGLGEIEKKNKRKADLLYNAIDESKGFYRCPAEKSVR
ncbi:unnamed protein product [Prunus armeniaca]|uniref:Uncharacterized protein n=1 Tax=Prunus armeniaca TaxID=36596 RepID=A0A6J5VIE5_PRUAR|nr:unnamed protein product [Prunus armeniaca]